jgi:hypothetical protein
MNPVKYPNILPVPPRLIVRAAPVLPEPPNEEQNHNSRHFPSYHGEEFAKPPIILGRLGVFPSIHHALNPFMSST